MKKTFSAAAFTLVIASSLILSGCGNSEKGNDNNRNDSIPADTSGNAAAENVEMKIYTLPAQMQVPSALASLKAKYSGDILVPVNTTTSANATQFKKAIVMGALGVDMGYATVFGQNQVALKYFTKIGRLAEDMKITGAFDPAVITRFKDNSSNKDSASFLLISSFNNASQFLDKNNRKDVGLLIATGSFIEGLYLSTSIYQKDKSKEALNIIGMQKVFAGNLVELLSDYADQKEINDLSASLKDLQKSYDAITVTYTDANNGFMGEVKEVTATADQLNELGRKVGDIRKMILE